MSLVMVLEFSAAFWPAEPSVSERADLISQLSRPNRVSWAAYKEGQLTAVLDRVYFLNEFEVAATVTI